MGSNGVSNLKNDQGDMFVQVKKMKETLDLLALKNRESQLKAELMDKKLTDFLKELRLDNSYTPAQIQAINKQLETQVKLKVISERTVSNIFWLMVFVRFDSDERAELLKKDIRMDFLKNFAIQMQLSEGELHALIEHSKNPADVDPHQPSTSKAEVPANKIVQDKNTLKRSKPSSPPTATTADNSDNNDSSSGHSSDSSIEDNHNTGNISTRTVHVNEKQQTKTNGSQSNSPQKRKMLPKKNTSSKMSKNETHRANPNMFRK